MKFPWFIDELTNDFLWLINEFLVLMNFLWAIDGIVIIMK